MHRNIVDLQRAVAIAYIDKSLETLPPPESVYDVGDLDELLDHRLTLMEQIERGQT